MIDNDSKTTILLSKTSQNKMRTKYRLLSSLPAAIFIFALILEVPFFKYSINYLIEIFPEKVKGRRMGKKKNPEGNAEKTAHQKMMEKMTDVEKAAYRDRKRKQQQKFRDSRTAEQKDAIKKKDRMRDKTDARREQNRISKSRIVEAPADSPDVIAGRSMKANAVNQRKRTSQMTNDQKDAQREKDRMRKDKQKANGPYRCPIPICQSVYSYPKDLLKHIKQKHATLNPCADEISLMNEISSCHETEYGDNEDNEEAYVNNEKDDEISIVYQKPQRTTSSSNKLPPQNEEDDDEMSSMEVESSNDNLDQNAFDHLLRMVSRLKFLSVKRTLYFVAFLKKDDIVGMNLDEIFVQLSTDKFPLVFYYVGRNTAFSYGIQAYHTRSSSKDHSMIYKMHKAKFRCFIVNLVRIVAATKEEEELLLADAESAVQHFGKESRNATEGYVMKNKRIEKGADAATIQLAVKLSAAKSRLFCTNSSCDTTQKHTTSGFPIQFPLHFKRNDFKEVTFSD